MIFSCYTEDCVHYSEDEEIGCTNWICGVTIADGMCESYEPRDEDCEEEEE